MFNIFACLGCVPLIIYFCITQGGVHVCNGKYSLGLCFVVFIGTHIYICIINDLYPVECSYEKSTPCYTVAFFAPPSISGQTLFLSFNVSIFFQCFLVGIFRFTRVWTRFQAQAHSQVRARRHKRARLHRHQLSDLLINYIYIHTLLYI